MKEKQDNQPTLTPPNEPLTCGLVDRHGMPLRAGDTVAADKFFVYAVRYGSHNVNPDNCAPAYQVGWYLEIMWAYPGFEDSVGHTEPLYDIDGTAARYPAHCAPLCLSQLDLLNKTVFLTREAAEAALKEREKDES